MPLGAEYATQNCPIAGSLEVVGERWTLLILRDALYGRARYDEFQRSLGIATNVLSSRLKKLVDAGVFEQPEGPRGEYRLTQQGRDLLPVLMSLKKWGETYGLDRGAPAVKIVHAPCDHELDTTLHCAHCRESVGIEDLRITLES